MEIIRFALLGLATGAIYALLAQGLVLVYRGSGLLNFAQGAVAMFGAYTYYELTVKQSMPKVVGVVLTLALCAVLGAALHLGILRTMRRSSPLSRVIATLGILLVLQSIAFLRYGHDPLQVPSLLPTKTVHIISDELPIGIDRVIILAIAIVLTAVLMLLYRTTSFGRVTTAVAENELAAASLGHSPDRIATINWALGSVLAGLAGVLIAPIIFLEPTALVMLVIPAMSAALLGQFSAFGVTLVMALALGVAQSEISRYVSQPGWATAAPFVAIIVVLLVRGRGLPLRSFVLDRLPSVGSGRVRYLVVIPLWIIGSAVALSATEGWSSALVTTFGMAIICLSVVVLTGYTGQLSLAQYVLAGLGVLIAAKLVDHMPFVITVIVAAAATAALGGLFGLPALRTRGATLAVVTLGLGGAVADVVLFNGDWTGGVSGIFVPVPSIFGWSLDPFEFAGRYAFVTLTVFSILAIMVANLRRGITGRRMLAVRSNERAAASLGVHVAWVKSYAFMLASGIAAVGGVLLAFVQPSVQVNSFVLFTGILIIAVTVTAGVGYVPGALLGALLMTGGVVSELLSGWDEVNDYLPLIGGVVLLMTLMMEPNGLFVTLHRTLGRFVIPVLDLGERLLVSVVPKALLFTKQDPARGIPHSHRVEANELKVSGISVSFGGVHAVKDVSITVRPGEVHGLIGPNGAGKTTLIDAITGFVKASDGSVQLGTTEIGSWAPRRRSLAGMSRSFQSLELFSDLTVGENLAVATEQLGHRNYLTDLVAPGRIHLSDAALEAIRQFELADLIDTKPTEISFGKRKTVAIARSIASSPSVLLLDEPAAGLDDQEAAELATLIRQLADLWGIGVLLVEHKVDMIMATCDRVTVLQSGQVLAEGTPAQIRSNAAVAEAYLGAAVKS